MGLGGVNNRVHPRIDCVASVKVQAGGESISLTTKNISLGGVMLNAKPEHLKLLPLGSMLDVTLEDPMDERNQPVRTSARVVRHEEGGVALIWASADPDTTSAIADIIEKVQAKKL